MFHSNRNQDQGHIPERSQTINTHTHTDRRMLSDTVIVHLQPHKTLYVFVCVKLLQQRICTFCIYTLTHTPSCTIQIWALKIGFIFFTVFCEEWHSSWNLRNYKVTHTHTHTHCVSWSMCCN